MKKTYQIPQTTTIQLLGVNAIMSGSPTATLYDLYDGTGAPTGMD